MVSIQPAKSMVLDSCGGGPTIGNRRLRVDPECSGAKMVGYLSLFMSLVAFQTDMDSLDGSWTVSKYVGQFALHPSTQTILYSDDQAICNELESKLSSLL